MNAFIYHQFLCFHEMKHETEDQNRIEKRDRVINLQVNRPGIFVYLFDLGRILASWVILGELFSFCGAYFLHLKEYDPNVSSRPGQNSPSSLLF